MAFENLIDPVRDKPRRSGRGRMSRNRQHPLRPLELHH